MSDEFTPHGAGFATQPQPAPPRLPALRVALLITLVLAVSTIIVAMVVSIGIARAADLDGLDAAATPIAMMLGFAIAAVASLTTLADIERRSRG